MRRQKVLKILGVVICVLLSLFLVVGVTAVPFYYSVTALTEPETVAMVIQEVDYKQAIEKSPTVKKTLEKYGITSDEAQTVMKSKQTGEIIEIYADEVTEILLDIPQDKTLDIPYIKHLVDENVHEFLDIAEKNTDLKFKRNTVERDVEAFFKTNEQTIEQSIPVVQEIREIVKTVHTSRIVKNTLSFGFAAVLVAIAFVVIGIIIAIRRSNGFLWVGVDFAVISVLLCIIIAFSKSNFITRTALEISDFGTRIIESAISISTEKMIIAVFGTVIMTVLFMGFFVALKFLKRKYQKVEYIQIPVENE